MIDPGNEKRLAFARWNSCVYSGQIVTMKIVDADKAEFKELGFCSDSREKIDITQTCRVCKSHSRTRKRPKKAITPLRRKRIETGMRRRKARREEAHRIRTGR